MTRSCMETDLQPFADHLLFLFNYSFIYLFVCCFFFFLLLFFFSLFFSIYIFPFSYLFSYLGSDKKKNYEPRREKIGFLPMQSVTHVVKYVKYCLEGLCCLLFFGLICFEACSKNSIGVSYYTDRKKKETILCIENRLYIKIM